MTSRQVNLRMDPSPQSPPPTRRESRVGYSGAFDTLRNSGGFRSPGAGPRAVIADPQTGDGAQWASDFRAIRSPGRRDVYTRAQPGAGQAPCFDRAQAGGWLALYATASPRRLRMRSSSAAAAEQCLLRAFEVQRVLYTVALHFTALEAHRSH